MPMHEAILGAAKIDFNSGPPAHIMRLDIIPSKWKIEVYE
jgi:hypothetical protein